MGPSRGAVRHPISWFLIGGDLYTAYTVHRGPRWRSEPAAIAFLPRFPTPSSSIRSCSSCFHAVEVSHKHVYIHAALISVLVASAPLARARHTDHRHRGDHAPSRVGSWSGFSHIGGLGFVGEGWSRLPLISLS